MDISDLTIPSTAMFHSPTTCPASEAPPERSFT